MPTLIWQLHRHYSQASTRMEFVWAVPNLMVVNLWRHFAFALLYKNLSLAFRPFSFGWLLPGLPTFKKKCWAWRHFKNAHGSIIKVADVAIKEEDLIIEIGGTIDG